MNRSEKGFSLIELTLALGIVAFALFAILGLVPVGLKSAGQSMDATRASMISADAESRVRASVSAADFTSATARTVASYYSKDGIWVSSSPIATAFYRVDATIQPSWANPLTNVDQTYLRPATAIIRWPVNTVTGAPITTNNSTFTFFVRKP
jgi:uncharacterized protein (TIGR02598 family)